MVCSCKDKEYEYTLESNEENDESTSESDKEN